MTGNVISSLIVQVTKIPGSPTCIRPRLVMSERDREREMGGGGGGGNKSKKKEKVRTQYLWLSQHLVCSPCHVFSLTCIAPKGKHGA